MTAPGDGVLAEEASEGVLNLLFKTFTLTVGLWVDIFRISPNNHGLVSTLQPVPLFF